MRKGKSLHFFFLLHAAWVRSRQPTSTTSSLPFFLWSAPPRPYFAQQEALGLVLIHGIHRFPGDLESRFHITRAPRDSPASFCTRAFIPLRFPALAALGVPLADILAIESVVRTSLLLNFGDNRRNGGSFNGQHFKVTCGRTSARHSVPMQIRWEDIRNYCEPTIEQSNIQQWLRLKTEFQGSCPQKVLSINEERTVDWYLHFHVPQKLEATFPKHVCLEGKKILVEHALPFAPVRSSISRPPVEESMHEHWKNTASLAPALKKNRSNCIAAC